MSRIERGGGPNTKHVSRKHHPRGDATTLLVIHLTSVADACDEHPLGRIIHLVDDTVLTNSDAVDALVSLQLH